MYNKKLDINKTRGHSTLPRACIWWPPRTALQDAIGNGWQKGPKQGVPQPLVTEGNTHIGTLLGGHRRQVVEQAAAQGIQGVTG